MGRDLLEKQSLGWSRNFLSFMETEGSLSMPWDHTRNQIGKNIITLNIAFT
jgi:hypothetical protein